MFQRARTLVLRITAALCFFVPMFVSESARPQALATSSAAEGRVTDPSGAVISGAAVTLIAANGSKQTTSSDPQGRYRLRRLAPGTYVLRVESPGFALFDSGPIEIGQGQVHEINAKLSIETKSENVTVSDSATIGVDPTQNGSQMLLKGSDLDAFSDDSEELANELQMLAGPSAGPSGPQIYIDGFTDGILPPKQSIREIKINQNPFSAEYDKIGFGRVEVFTKPGSERLRGQASINFGDRALTARNPYIAGPLVPNYKQEIMTGNLSGPLSKRASFFLDGQGRVTDENAVLNYTQLDTNLDPANVSTALVTPSRRYSFSPRLDYALSPNHTLVVRYSLAHIGASNQGLSPQAFDQASLAYNSEETDRNVQVSESAVFGSSILNNLRFQFYRTDIDQHGVSSAPQLNVQGTFTSGGSFPRNFTARNRYELDNGTTIAHGAHTIDFGLRWRGDWLDEQATTNFNGTFTFSSNVSGLSALEVYQQNLSLAQQGVSQQQIAAMGFGPSQFQLTAGIAEIGVDQNDLSLFLQDDWKLRSNLTLSGGLRYELQNVVHDCTNLAPRVAVAWAPNPKSSQTVLRAGTGIFYDRFTSDLIWNAIRQDGAHQTQYIIRNPTFFPEIPDPGTLATLSQQNGSSGRATYQIDPRLRAPRLLQTAVSLEQALPGNTSLALTYMNTRGWHQLRTNDINAPLPTATDAQGTASGPRPLGDTLGDIYQ